MQSSLKSGEKIGPGRCARGLLHFQRTALKNTGKIVI
jgi:hypothetical protein